MSFVPTAKQLHGLSYPKAELFGKPDVGAEHTAFNAKAYRLTQGSQCTVCSQGATNSHHAVPLGIQRSFMLDTPIGRFVTLSPVIALCGSGTTGCHGKFHDGTYSIRWEWDSEESAENWWDGTLLGHFCAQGSPKLFELGRYVISLRGNDILEVRR